MTTTPTRATADQWQAAFDYFNRQLFDSRLPPCLITLRGGKRCHGYFSPDRFADVSKSTVNLGAMDEALPEPEAEPITTDEIAMNPQSIATRGVLESLSTLAHEMTHLEQQHFGEAPRRAYHDRQWAGMMKRIGLQPTDTGLPGGKETGQHMTHLIVEGGRFDVAARRLIAEGFAISWGEKPTAGGGKKAGKRAKYVCPACNTKAWAKFDVALICGDCEEQMECA